MTCHVSQQNSIKPAKIELLQPRSRPSTKANASARLDTVAALLHSPKRLKYTTLECFKLYQERKKIIISDLLLCPDHKVHDFLIANFRRSKLLAAFTLDQICDMIVEGNVADALNFLKLLDQKEVLSKLGTPKVQLSELSQVTSVELLADLSRSVVMEYLSIGEPLAAALCAFKLVNNGISIDEQTYLALISSLSVNTPQRRNYHSYTIAKLFETFNEFNLPITIKIDAIMSMIGGPVIPFFANTCYDKLVNQTENSEWHLLSSLTRELIHANLDCGNFHRCVRMWRDSCKQMSTFARNNIALFARIIESLTPNDLELAIALIEETFPSDLHKSPEVINSILAGYGQSPGATAKFEKLTHLLQPPLQRKALSLLFISFLHQGNETAAERVLKAILGTKNGLNADDFLAIVRKLLRQHKIYQSIKMCKNTQISVAKVGYVNVVEFFLIHLDDKLGPSSDITRDELDEKRGVILAEISRKLQILPKDDVALKKLTVAIVRYLSGHVSNKASQRFYINFSDSENPEKPFFPLQTYLLPQEFEKLVYIDNSNRLRCLSVILNQAIVDRDSDILRWSAQEMVSIGLLAEEINEYYLSLSEAQALLN